MSAESSDSQSIALYRVRLVNAQEGIDRTLEIPANEYILESALQQGLTLPYYCQVGCCTTCVSKLETGSVNQGDQCALNEPELSAQLILLCCALPTADCTITTHQQQTFRTIRGD